MSAGTTDVELEGDAVDDGDAIDDQGGCGANPSNVRRSMRRLARRWRSIAVTCTLVAAACVTAALYFDVYRVDRADSGATAAIEAASKGSVALLSYAPATWNQDLATARSYLTGEFLTYYSQFADQFVVPAAKDKEIHATASVLRAAAIDVRPESAQVLVFMNQETTSRDRTGPARSESSVKVGLTKVDGAWRISSFDPL